MIFVSQTGRTSRPFYDPSARYRAFALAEHFRRKGKRVAFMSQKTFEKEAESFTTVPLILFHRPGGSEEMLRYVARHRKRQTLIADYDDLVFDVTAVRQTPAVLDRDEDVSRVAQSIAARAEIGTMFERRTASTVPLAAQADRIFGGATKVIHNALDPTYLGIAHVLGRKAAMRCVSYDIGYFSGTASHNRDLAMIAPQIADYLAEDRSHTMLVVGPVALPSQLRPFAHRIMRRKITSFYEMPRQIATCRMVVAPLVDNVFAQCKSGLKFFEAGILGVPVAATPIPDIDRFENPLLRKCRNSGDWAKALRSAAPANATLRAAVDRVATESRIEIQMDAWASEFLGA